MLAFLLGILTGAIAMVVLALRAAKVKPVTVRAETSREVLPAPPLHKHDPARNAS